MHVGHHCSSIITERVSYLPDLIVDLHPEVFVYPRFVRLLEAWGAAVHELLKFVSPFDESPDDSSDVLRRCPLAEASADCVVGVFHNSEDAEQVVGGQPVTTSFLD